jgi:hypothetical protein
MKELLEPLVPLILIAAGVCWTAVWVFLNSPMRPTVKALLIPGVLFGALAAPVLTFLLLGYSVKLPLPEEIVVLSHRTLVVENKKTRIEVWGKAPDAKATRLYSIPYTKQMEKQLEKAEEGRKQGQESHIKKRGKRPNSAGTNAQGDESQSDWELTLRQPENLPPKDGPAMPSAPPSPSVPDVMR